MPELSVTDDQRERLRRVQEHLAEDVAYGHVRPCDALEYLLDCFDEESGSRTESAATAKISKPSDGAVHSSAGFEVRNGTPTTNVQGPLGDERDETDGNEGENSAEARVVDAGESADTADATSTTSGAEDEDTEVSETANDSDGTDDSGGASDDARLSSVMSLLADHDDVWREADGGDAKYEVDLPDGGTERARTKDDVRAVLFKHYR